MPTPNRCRHLDYGVDGLELFVQSDEAAEGVKAFGEKRDPDSVAYR